MNMNTNNNDTMDVDMGEINSNVGDPAPFVNPESFWWKTMPARTGTFEGHAVPAFFFIVFALVVLLISLHRARNLPPGKTFAELHIPERNPKFLSTFGSVIIVATSIGFLQESIGAWIAFGNPFGQLAHETLYFSYFIVALCAILESKGRLPPDTYRAAMVLALIAGYLMWYSHGTMKLLAADQSLHMLLGYVNLANAAVIAYSMRFTDSVIAFIAGFAMLILQGTWLLTAGAYECCVDLPMHEIATYLAVQSLLVLLVIVAIVAIFGPEHQQFAHQNNNLEPGEFSVLKQHVDDGYEGNDDGEH